MEIVFVPLFLIALVALALFLGQSNPTRSPSRSKFTRSDGARPVPIDIKKTQFNEGIDIAQPIKTFDSFKGSFDRENLLHFSEGFYREDLPFLTDQEFENYSRLGSEAIKSFSPRPGPLGSNSCRSEDVCVLNHMNTGVYIMIIFWN